jgi:Fe(II)/alpha-ketoglutarate-dependent arginine beta-hydroxylase
MSRLVLEQGEIESIQGLLKEIIAGIATVEDEAFQSCAAVYAQELPRRVRRHMHDFKLHEPETAVCVISGIPLDQEKIGPTPAHWKSRNGTRSGALEEEVLLVLFGSLLGDCIGWATQQDGYVVHDILPIKGHEGEQLGSGSEQLLWWHTEDAFHPYRGDYLGMMCLRNPDAVATTFATVEDLPLTEAQLDLLFQPHFTIRPDESHLMKNRAKPQMDGEVAASYDHIEQMNSEPERIAVLCGDRRSPYIRIDPYFMDPVRDNEPAQAALDALVAAIESRIGDLVLEAGDYCFLDNCKSVHGRKPFKARFDGTDRWFKRINITRDLRKSRTSRHEASSRIIL